jgi:hypothetical protein
MSLEGKAELIMAIGGYECEEIQRLDNGIDFIASNANSDDKMLLRIITETESKSGVVGVDIVKRMTESVEQECYNEIVLIGKRFSEAAKEEMSRNNIQMISEKFMPSFKPEKLYLRIQSCVDYLCKNMCGQAPQKESDCKDYYQATPSCKVRLISDNASFHLQFGWTKLLQHDLIRIINLIKNKRQQKAGISSQNFAHK